jgi:thioredoxin reductase
VVLSVDTKTRPFTIITNETEIKTNSIVVATGADSRWLGVPGEWEMRGGGVSSCATCDGYLFADQDVVVIGGGDTAMEDALVLARTSKSVTVIHRRDKFRASKVLADRVLSHDKIKVRWDTEIVAFEGKRQRVLSNGLTVEIDADGKIVAEDFSKMRVKEVQKRLDAAGIRCVCVCVCVCVVSVCVVSVCVCVKELEHRKDAAEG